MSALSKTTVNIRLAEAEKNFIAVKLMVRLRFTRLRNTVVTKSLKAIKKRTFQQCCLGFILSLTREN